MAVHARDGSVAGVQRQAECCRRRRGTWSCRGGQLTSSAIDANPHGVLWGSGAQLYFCRGSVQSAGVWTLNTKSMKPFLIVMACSSVMVLMLNI